MLQLLTAEHTEDAGDARVTTPWYLTATTLAAIPWLTRLRWARALVDLTVIVVALAFLTLDFPLRRVAPLVAATAAVNVAVAIQLSKGHRTPGWLAMVDLLMQPLLLTELLELTGGPFNPFAVAYAVPVTLAAVTIGARASAGVAAVSVGGYGLLAFWHLSELVPGHHRLNDFPTHLFTLWLALAWTAELAAYFLVQASNALARREQQLEAARRQTARAERVASLTTLAAGAAHELSTPLGTIALAARELERSATERGTVPDLAEDARLIRTEVDRCRAILDHMSGRAGGSAADDARDMTVEQLVAEIRSRLPRDREARLVVHADADAPVISLPANGLLQAVLSLVTNGLDAGAASHSSVHLTVTIQDESLIVTVNDRGPGMSADVLRHVGEPFFTTKEPGRGLGLGLFLARVFAERVGGTLALESSLGTLATLQVPLRVADDGSRT